MSLVGVICFSHDGVLEPLGSLEGHVWCPSEMKTTVILPNKAPENINGSFGYCSAAKCTQGTESKFFLMV